VNALWREIIGEPDAGKPHVRFDEGALMRLNTLRHAVAACGETFLKVVMVSNFHQRSTLHYFFTLLITMSCFIFQANGE